LPIRPPLAGGRIGADLLGYQQQDAGGYGLHLEYAYPIAPHWALLASLEALGQRSNLELFDVSGRAVFRGVRWQSAC